MAQKLEKTYPSADGKTTIHALCWLPVDRSPAAILQVAHGMQEFIDRYDSFAAWMAGQGIAVVGHDHLGHGASVSSQQDWGYFTEGDGSAILVEDVHSLRRMMQQEYPGVPYFLLGHSMGSFILRRYLMEYGGGLSGAIICGTGYKAEVLADIFLAVCRALAALRGWNCRSKLADELFFSGSFHRFNMDGTIPENSWLTSDAESVRRYFAEPRCTFPFTISGYYTITRLIKTIQRPDKIARTPRELPLLFVSGADDPVGEFGTGVRKVCELYRKTGHEKLELKLYPRARHEVLNEVNRAQYWQDILAWCRKHS